MATTTFKSLTDTVFDSIEGYRKAIEKAEAPELKAVLRRRLESREAVLADMNAELQRQGDELVTKGTFTGELHQLWMKVADLFENADEAAAERVEEGEDYLKDKFEAALAADTLEAQERAIVERAHKDVLTGERFGDMLEKQYD